MPNLKRILIIDDDSDDREMFCEALAEVMPECICYQAPNGRKALLLLETYQSALPHLIFLDLNMPVMNGWQALGHLKASAPYRHIPVIVYSTSSYAEDVEKATRLGALCFFSKPSAYKLLKSSIGLVMEHLQTGSLAQVCHHSPFFQTYPNPGAAG